MEANQMYTQRQREKHTERERERKVRELIIFFHAVVRCYGYELLRFMTPE